MFCNWSWYFVLIFSILSSSIVKKHHVGFELCRAKFFDAVKTKNIIIKKPKIFNE